MRNVILLPVMLVLASCTAAPGLDAGVEAGPERPVARGIYPGVPFPFEFPTGGEPTASTCGEYHGTPDNWVFVTVNTNSRCALSGSYIVLENSRIAHRLNITGHHIVVRHSEICCTSAGALVSVRPGSHNIAIIDNEVHSNGAIPSKTDRHGIRLDGDTSDVWILDNHVHRNSGDGIQFCHGCIGNGNGPANVYISGNEFHEDEENAIDLKEFRGPVVVTCNRMYGYRDLGFSGHGEAFRVNDEGAQGELWSAHNVYSDNAYDVMPFRSDAGGWFLDEDGSVGRGATAVSTGKSALQYYRLFEQRYGVVLRDACDQYG